MKPHAYLRLYPGDWLRDTMHLDATATGAYFLLILAHRGKPGIPSDDTSLRTIARVSSPDWPRVRAQLSLFFKESNGLWVNSRAVRDWEKDCAEYELAKKRTEAATAARKNVTTNVTKPSRSPHVARSDSQSESESESESYSESDSQSESISVCAGAPKRKKSNFVPPSIEEIRLQCAKIGLPDREAESFFNHHDTRGWILKGGLKMVSWRSALSYWKGNWQKGMFQPNGEQKPGLFSKMVDEGLKNDIRASEMERKRISEIEG